MLPPSVLIIDDSPSNVRLAEVHLRKAGYTIYTATNADDALHTLKTCHPPINLVLMDIHLGDGIDGIALTHIIRAIPGWRTRPIIIATSVDDAPWLRRAALLAGCNDMLDVPLNYSRLVSMLAPFLALSA